ncbi:hypothetical protein HanHA300_Chr13g0490891 [Helianthus annuus]|nr:hypothetical protein HanHA300_Chr13g0490891 [Helianthus annuus]KAJ0498473.1 hypothetical protein HanHA89_Chr13g0523021 [Helianthus annuus]KAJ0664489.1 hypothetical protein HanLR1_Chr13g0493021 [Helianthus annuus]
MTGQKHLSLLGTLMRPMGILFNPTSKRIFTRRDVNIKEDAQWEWLGKVDKHVYEASYAGPFPIIDEVTTDEDSHSVHSYSSKEDMDHGSVQTPGSSSAQSIPASSSQYNSSSSKLKALDLVYSTARVVEPTYDDYAICQFACRSNEL